MKKIDSIKLVLLSIVKGLFFIVTYPIIWLLFLVDILVHFLSIGMFEGYLTEHMTRFTIYVMKKMLQIEFKIIFNK